MYWTYGEDHIKLEKERSRHYVDLNLHVETKNYEDGENVKIMLRRDDKLPIYDSTAEIPLEGTVIDNHAVVDNVFQERLLNIGLQGDAVEKIVPTVMLPDGTEELHPEAALDPHRPSWDAVYEGYPLQFRGTDNVKEETKENVFISVLGEKHDTKTFNNACATRVSIALIKANMRVKKDFLVQVGKHAGQGFIASAKGLQEWLSQENVWNTADVTVDKTDKDTFPGKTNLEIIREKLNGKKGVYIILGGFQKGITGHATLWTGTDVIGGKDDDVEDNTYSSHIDNGATVYFWELKTCVRGRNVLHRILPNTPTSGFINVAGEEIYVDYNMQGIFKMSAAYRKEMVRLYIPDSILHFHEIKYKWPDVHKKLSQGNTHYIYVPENYRPGERYSDGGDYFAFAFYHELAHILHPEGVPLDRENDKQNIRSEYVADETAVAKLGWGADEYREYIRNTFDNDDCSQDMLDNKNGDVPEKYTQEKHHCHARSQLLKDLEDDRRNQVGK